MYFDQSGYQVRCEWGRAAIDNLDLLSDVAVIVDVLSFTTCVDIAVGRGAVIYPFGWNDDRAAEFAGSVAALVASRHRSGHRFSLSPVSLLGIEEGTRLVLPSPNGAALSLAAPNKPTLA